jgi:NTE family protein
VLEVFEREGITLRGVAGTSMGAVIGAMVVAWGSTEATVGRWREALRQQLIPTVPPLRRLPGPHEHPLAQVARRIRNRIVVSMAVNRATVLDGRALLRAFEFLVPARDLSELETPVLVVATDLETGAEVWLRQGPLGQVLAASCAIPGLLPAVTADDRLLVDGGVVAEVPVRAGRSLGWPVVAVDVSMTLPPLHRDALVLDTMMRSQMMTSTLLRAHQLGQACMVVRPQVGHATWADWPLFEELVAAGRRAAEELLGVSGPPPAGEQPVAEG